MRLFAALAYVSPLIWISQCLPIEAATSTKKAKKAELTVEQFVRKLVSEGSPAELNPSMARLVELSPTSPSRLLAAAPEDTTDGWLRAARVILRETDGKQEPSQLYWLLEKRKEDGKEVYYYLTSLEGALQKAVRLEGKNGSDGKPLRGSGTVTKLDVSAKGVRERFQDRVLDFWLKDKYRSRAKRN